MPTLLPPELLTLTFAYLVSVSAFMLTPEMMDSVDLAIVLIVGVVVGVVVVVVALNCLPFLCPNL
jgi:hypothetical protein